jgi:hypothetical protein
LSAARQQIYYTLLFDNSNLADDAAREADITRRRTSFTAMLRNMKILVEGGTLPPGAVRAPGRPVATPSTKQSSKQIGIERFGAHDLRRTWAKLCRKNGGDLEQIKFLAIFAQPLEKV